MPKSYKAILIDEFDWSYKDKQKIHYALKIMKLRVGPSRRKLIVEHISTQNIMVISWDGVSACQVTEALELAQINYDSFYLLEECSTELKRCNKTN